MSEPADHAWMRLEAAFHEAVARPAVKPEPEPEPSEERPSIPGLAASLRNPKLVPET